MGLQTVLRHLVDDAHAAAVAEVATSQLMVISDDDYEAGMAHLLTEQRCCAPTFGLMLRARGRGAAYHGV